MPDPYLMPFFSESLHDARELSFYDTICPSDDQNLKKRRFYTNGTSDNHVWCGSTHVSTSFTLVTKNVESEDVEISLFSDDKCDHAIAWNLTFDGCIVGPRQVCDHLPLSLI